jgi:Leucine-rich repeat (LRR) protein
MKDLVVFLLALVLQGICAANVTVSGSHLHRLFNGQVEAVSKSTVDRRSWKASMSREEYRERKRDAKRSLLEEQRRLKEGRRQRQLQERLERRNLVEQHQQHDQNLVHTSRLQPFLRGADRHLQLSNHMQLAQNWFNSHPLAPNITATERQQLMTMAAFYYSTGGNNWFLRDNWLSYVTNECFWYNQALEASCNPNNFLVELELEENNLGGFLMTEIHELYNLQKLDLETNSIRGTIPTEIARLEELTIKENNFTGPIPTEFGMLLYLEELDLSENQLTGTLPDTLGNMTSLETLDLYFNLELNGTIPANIWTLPELEELKLEFNYFRDTIPTTIGLSTSLEDLNLEHNYFFGPIPTELGNITSLIEIELEHNDFTGTCTFT